MQSENGNTLLRLRPISFKKANDFVEKYHRHHGRCPPGFHNGVIAVEDENGLHGVAILGRPSNRNNDDGYTLEVLRVATDGTRNAASMLLGACGRIAKQMGADRIITYTLEKESGASLRAANWREMKRGITSWWHIPTANRSVAVARQHLQEAKVRWELDFE